MINNCIILTPIVSFSLVQNGHKVELTFLKIIVYFNVECYGVLCIEIHLPWNPLLESLVVDIYNFYQNQIFETIFQSASMIYALAKQKRHA